MAATRQLDQAVTPAGRVHGRSGRRIVRHACVTYCVCESQQIVRARLQLLVDCESDHFPTPWRRKALRMRLAKVIAMRLDLVCQRAEDRRGISVSVGQCRGGWMRAPSSRTTARPHVPDGTPRAASIVGSAAVSGSRAAVVRTRSRHARGHVFSYPSDNEEARSALAMFAPPICRMSRRNVWRTELILQSIFSSGPTKTAAPRLTLQRAERAIDTASLASEAIKIGSRAAVVRTREQTRFFVCERGRSRRLPSAIRAERAWRAKQSDQLKCTRDQSES